MATLKIHEQDCVQLLGERFTEVHESLDELFKYVVSDHKGYRQNCKGVEEVQKGWGDRAAPAAEIY